MVPELSGRIRSAGELGRYVRPKMGGWGWGWGAAPITVSARKFPTWKAGVPAYDHEEIIKLTALNIRIKRHDNCKWLAAVACFFVSIFLCDHNNLRQIFLTYGPWNPWGGMDGLQRVREPGTKNIFS